MTRLLLVDDDPALLRLMGDYFRRRGFEMSTAGNGAETLTEAREQHPDLIVLDVTMPELDGMLLEKYAPRCSGDLDDWGRTALPVAFDLEVPEQGLTTTSP